MYVGNLYEIVTERDLDEVFGLTKTSYLIDNYFIKMSKLQRNGRHNNGHACILAPCKTIWLGISRS